MLFDPSGAVTLGALDSPLVEWPRTRPEHANPSPSGRTVGRDLTRRGWLVGSLVAGWGLRGAGRHRHARTGRDRGARQEGRPAAVPVEPDGALSRHRRRPRPLTASRRSRIGRSLATAFQKHFRGKGFDVTLPEHRLTVVTLASPDSYAAFLGEDPGPVVGGHYDLDTNRLVIFDFRPDAANLAADPRAGQHADADPRGDPPADLQHRPARPPRRRAALPERGPGHVRRSLASRRPSAAGGDQHAEAPGARRRPATRPRPGFPWIDCSPTTSRSAPRRRSQQAYAQSWLWVHALLTRPRRASPGSAPTSTPSAPVAIPSIGSTTPRPTSAISTASTARCSKPPGA